MKQYMLKRKFRILLTRVRKARKIDDVAGNFLVNDMLVTWH